MAYPMLCRFPMMKSIRNIISILAMFAATLNSAKAAEQDHNATAWFNYFGDHGIGEHCKLEVGYMEQTVQHRDGRVFENNHTLMVSFLPNWPFRQPVH